VGGSRGSGIDALAEQREQDVLFVAAGKESAVEEPGMKVGGGFRAQGEDMVQDSQYKPREHSGGWQECEGMYR